MKKRMLAMLLPFCCLGVAPAFAEESAEEVTSPEVAITSSCEDEQTSDASNPPSLYRKKGGCGCGNGK